MFLTGINLTLLNFILVQHAAVAFREAEIAVLLFSLSFFSGISAGYFLSDRLGRSWVKRFLPLFLGLQLLLLVFLQPLHHVISSDVDRWADGKSLPGDLGVWVGFGVGFLLMSVGATSLYSVFLPAAIQDGQNLRRSYSIEILGSIVGLALVPILAGVSQEFLLSGYFVAFFFLCINAGVSRPALLGLAVIMVSFLMGFERWDKSTSGWFYKRWYGSWVSDVAYTRYTPYHKIEVLELDDGEFMLALNGKRQFARGSHFLYSYYLAEYPARLLGSPTVCLMGCGSMSTVGRIGDFVPSIRIVDLDPEVFKTSKRFFPQYNRLNELDNWTFTADDAKHFMANNDEQFDLILHDIPPAKSRQIALTYTREFFSSVKEHLSSGGMFSIASLTPLSETSRYGKRMIATLADVFDRYFLLEIGSSVYFYGGGEGMPVLDRETLRNAIDHSSRDRIKIYLQGEVDDLVAGAKIITVNNVGDLIYE